MLNSISNRVDFPNTGTRMSRQRYQRGSLSRVGKTRQMWRGRWHVYITQQDGAEKICKREKILGPAEGLTKIQAQEKLDTLIKRTTRQVPTILSADLTLRQLWDSYAGLKSGTWSTATRKTLDSVFAVTARIKIDQVYLR